MNPKRQVYSTPQLPTYGNNPLAQRPRANRPSMSPPSNPGMVPNAPVQVPQTGGGTVPNAPVQVPQTGGGTVPNAPVQLPGTPNPALGTEQNWLMHLNAILEHLHSIGVPFVKDVNAAVSNPDPKARAKELQAVKKQMNSYKATQHQLDQAMNLR